MNIGNIKRWGYRHLIMPLLIARIRRKRTIDIVFVISDLGAWKTERLYKAMLEHPSLNPHLCVVKSLEDEGANPILINYLSRKGYEFSVLDESETIYSKHKADIIFYQKPYIGIIPEKQRFTKHWHSLFCFVPYAFTSVIADWGINQGLHQYAWKVFLENDSAARDMATVSVLKGENFCVTGLPMSEDFLINRDKVEDPWKNSSHKKRIIWAPHHTIPENGNLLDYSTFLDYSEFMKELAVTFKDKVQFAFKPHPLLRTKLNKRWGKERTDEYYDFWASQENTQLAEGGYVGLFLHSDAMIHDCASFTIEYHYTLNPVLYLTNGLKHAENMTSYAKDAYELHYMGANREEIEAFVKNVIDGSDPLRSEREAFVREYLTPKDQSACRNIINTILGE